MAIGQKAAFHFLSRTTFGGTPSQISAFAKLDRTTAVARILGQLDTPAVLAPPTWANEAPRRAKGKAERMELRKSRRKRGNELKQWWHTHLVTTSTPFVENIVLFWHNHFVSSIRKVRVPMLMFAQQQLFRTHLTNVPKLLHGIVEDPAMLIYLDNMKNRKKAPNENFGRELLELFTLGEGNYTEADIKSVARALTGNSVDRSTGKFRFVARRHDNDVKTVFGQSGNFDAADIVELLIDNPAFSNLLVEKTWHHFIGTVPKKSIVASLSRRFKKSNLDFKVLLKSILMHDDFWDVAQRGNKIKSPVEFTVGVVRNLGLKVNDISTLAKFNRRLGQDLLQPPNVRGWVGGPSWINSTQLLARHELVDRAVNTVGDAISRTGTWQLVPIEKLAANMLTVRPITIQKETTLTKRKDAIRQILLDPTFQLA